MNEWAQLFTADLLQYDKQSERSQQSEQGLLGPSDLVCRERARRVTVGTKPDREPGSLAAIFGTHIHEGIRQARTALNPNLLHEVEVLITLPSGATITGHADEVDPVENSVTDFKTVADLAYRKRIGADDNHIRQVTLYALGLVQQGVLAPDPLLRLAYLDRSGRISEPWVYEFVFDEENIRYSDAFIQDIIYAVQHGEHAQKDWPREMCRKFCQFYFSCRTDDIPDGWLSEQAAIAARTYVQANREIKEATSVKHGAKEALRGVQGVTPEGISVRWTEVNTLDDVFERIDVRENVRVQSETGNDGDLL
jgi:hypothetical protein